MGDLSGGQALKHIVRSALQLPSDQGTQFYEFDSLPTVDGKKAFKLQYREALDSLKVSEEEANQIVAEANYAFSLNRDVMHSLEDDVKQAMGLAEFQAIIGETLTGSTEETVGSTGT